MITVKDLMVHMSTENKEIEAQIDEWLKLKVFPKFSKDGDGFEVPTNLGGIGLVGRLESRGFDVTDYSGHQGYFVYLSIPPQGE